MTGDWKFSPAFLLRAIALLAAVVLGTALEVGCGGDKGSTGSASTAPAAPTPTPAPMPTPQAQQNCPAVTLAENTGPSTGAAAFPAAAPLPPPAPGTTSAGSVCVSTPMNNATVTSPVNMAAVASLVNAIGHMRVYVDGTAVYFTFYNTLNALLWMETGTHAVEVIATDTSGNDVSTSLQLNVVEPANPTVSNLQNLPGWQPCTKLFAPGTPRAGQVCASGLGDATYTLTQNQSTPSLSGSAAKFTIGGSSPYSNELYTNYFAGGSNVSQFTYDLYFMIDQSERAQALEFDVNQTIDNSRWVFGTECNFKADGVWDLWDGVTSKWVPSTVPCKPFPANTWIHLTWNFERVGSQVHYVSVAVNGQTYNVDVYHTNEPFWSIEDIDVAFQMDGDYAQQPYTVWLDQVSLTAN
jgi:hypothetical protein